ncbi:MAG: ABC transporter permease subunit [Lachnospiraceae bacterium]|nr:ABC transporter permease subunit [Lachnospiraceae bacterium]
MTGRTRRRGRYGAYFCMLAPGFLWLIFFNVVPMFGIYMAFTNFNPGIGIFRSPFTGLENFRYMFVLGDVKQVFFNTFYIAVSKVIMNLIFPLVFALLLNEVTHSGFKKLVQTVCYMPHFLSWVILAGILASIFSFDGPINGIRGMMGLEPFLFFGSAKAFPHIIIWSDVWKEFGYNAVIYLAAITGIDQGLYEAAAIDGAGRWQQTWHITLPGIRTTIVLLAILALGNVLNAGFDQVFNLYNPSVYSTGDILDTWVYRAGLKNFQYSLATAVGLLKSVISFVLIAVSYWMAKRFANYTIF